MLAKNPRINVIVDILMKTTATLISFILVFLPAIGNAEMSDFFNSIPSDDKVLIESFSKPVRKTDNINLTRISSIRESGDNKEYIIRTVLDDSMMEIYSLSDSSLICKGLSETSCTVVEVLTVCSQDLHSKKLSNCKVHKEKYDAKRLQKEYGSIKTAIYNMFFNTQNFKLNCKSIITKKDAEKHNIKLETDVPSSLSSIIAFPFLVASLVAPYVGNYLLPPATGVSSALTNVGIGAASKAASELTGVAGVKILDGKNQDFATQTPECILPDKQP